MVKTGLVRFEILMDAGDGAQKAGDILIKALARDGKYVFSEPIIPSEISPPRRTKFSMSGVIIRVADFDITSIGNDSDVILASHEILLSRRLEDNEYHVPAKVLLDMSDQEKNPASYAAAIKDAQEKGLDIFPFQIDQATKDLMGGIKREAGRGTGNNMYYLGILTYIFNVNLDIVLSVIRKTFAKLSEDRLTQNITIFTNGYHLAKTNFNFSVEIDSTTQEGEDKILIDGNTAMALGVIDAGFKFFAGYPITPASSIMHILAKYMPHFGGRIHQAEDEIAAIGAAIGGYYGGVPSLTCTSGPGLSLKQEFIGLALATETPLVLIDVQRGGPATGLPTRTEQSDLLACLFGTHGDSVRIILSVTDITDCFYAPHVARYITEKLRVPVVILSDGFESNSLSVIPKLISKPMQSVDDISDDILARFQIKRLTHDIEMVNENQSIPGDEGKLRRLVGLVTNKDGLISTAAPTQKRAHRIRNQKLHDIQASIVAPEIFGAPEGDFLIVGWGTTRGAIEEAVTKLGEEGIHVSSLSLRTVYPLPLSLKAIFSRFKKVVTVEIAYGDKLKPSPITMLLRNETLMDIEAIISEPTGRPVTPNEIKSKIKGLQS